MGGQRRLAVHGLEARRPWRVVVGGLGVIAVAVSCGTERQAQSPATPTDAPTPAPTVPVVDPETVAMCEDFLPDVFGGTIALVDFTFGDGEDKQFGTSPFIASDIEVTSVRMSTLRNEVSQGPLSVVTLRGGGVPDQVVGMRASLGEDRSAVGLLIPSQMDDVPQPRLAAVISGESIESGDVCAATYTKRLVGAAEVLGVDLVDAIERANEYFNDPSAAATLEVGWALGEYSGGVPTAMPPDGGQEPRPVDVWSQTPPESRDLDWNLMPDEVKANVGVFGVVVTVPPGFFQSEMYIRCELGVGYATLTNFEGDRPAAATLCLSSPTQIDFSGQVTEFPPEVWDAQFGNRIRLSSDPDGKVITITVETLAPGELEKITGLTRQQLEEQRELVMAGDFVSS